MSDEQKKAQVPCPDHPDQVGVRGKRCRHTWTDPHDGIRKRCGKGYGGVRL